MEKSIQASGSAGDIQVKLYADLSAAAFLHKLEDELALWYALRSLPTVKGGDITCGSLNDLVGQLAVFGYGQRTAFRQLTEANGRFFRIEQAKGRTVAKIYGPLTVCRALGIARLTMDRHSRLVNASIFNSLRKRRSQLYASIFKPEGVTAGPMKRETITTLTGLSRTQQRRYEKVIGIKRTPTYEVEEIKRLPTDLDTVMVTATMEVASKSRTHIVPRRLGNIYHSSQIEGRKGQTTRVKNSLIRIEKAQGQSKASLLTEVKEDGNNGTLPVRKAFFSSLKRLQKYCKGLQEDSREGFYLVRNNRRAIRGRLEWCHYQEDPGPLFRGAEC